MTDDHNYTAVLRDVKKVYRMGEMEISALSVANLKIKPGEFVAVLGPSGSGKTTLLNLLGGIDSPTSGQIFIGGEEVSAYSRRRLTRLRRDKIGFIFQFYNLIPTLTAKENVEFALELTMRGSNRPRRGALELLDMVGVKERADHFPYQLSGGEQQRVAVARSLAKDPVLILGDEPTGSLDFRMGKLVLQAMRDLNVSEGKTVVIVTHNIPITRMANRILRLHDGEIAEEEIIENPTPPENIVW